MSTPTVPTGRLSAGSAHDPCGEWALILLSAASGAADAFAFLCVGQVFAGVMTGNLVLLGGSAAGVGEHGVASRVVTALAAYSCGVALGAWMGERLRWRLPVILLVEVVLLATGAALWGLDLISSDGNRLGLLAVIALAIGIQGRICATPTNYFTGTLTAFVGRVALRSLRGKDGWVAGRLIAVVAGATATALTLRLRPDAAAVVAAVLVAGALLIEVMPDRPSRRG
ncbi:DUF1275 family protein [Streptomyces sp. NPDC005318]|uniref:DUF1275 family protein n=1 Tax=Streptomyces sp. NPDC005318 TaxID=3157031 RepID=UPI0033A64682